MALLALDVDAAVVREALARATAGMLTALREHDSRERRTGVYCCAKCCVSVRRNLAAGGLDHQDERMTRGIQYLREHRHETGEWQRLRCFATVAAVASS